MRRNFGVHGVVNKYRKAQEVKAHRLKIKQRISTFGKCTRCITYPLSEVVGLSEDVYNIGDERISAKDVRDRGHVNLPTPHILD